MLFTEHFIKNFKGNYKEFVKKFDDVYGAGKFNASFDRGAFDNLDSYKDPYEIKDILEYVRNNAEINYCYGDITRPSIVENINTETCINLSNVFEYKFNVLRKEEKEYWFEKIKKSDYDIEVKS